MGKVTTAAAILRYLPQARFGSCPACERRTLFVPHGPWLRDQYRCLRCWSIPRWRALSVVLDDQFPDWPSKRIHEIAPGGAASDRLRRRCRGYSYSFHGVPGEPFEDLMALSFPDESIDLFITQDVLEHITRPSDAFKEIARVLRPGGAHVFTVPIFQRERTVVRVSEDGTELMPADYHDGTEGKSLVVREWGRDITDYIDSASAVTSEVHRPESRRHGIEGEFLEVVVSRKAA